MTEAMTIDEFVELCEEAFGARWKRKVADELAVFPSTVNRWANGDTPISRKNEIAIRAMCKQRLLDKATVRDD